MIYMKELFVAECSNCHRLGDSAREAKPELFHALITREGWFISKDTETILCPRCRLKLGK